MDSKNFNEVFIKEVKEKGTKRIEGAKRKRKESGAESNEQLPEDNFEQNFFQDITEDVHAEYQKYKKDKQWKLDKIPHHLLPSFNLTKFTDINDVRDFPLLRVSLPHSVYVSSKQINDVDICHRRTIALSTYMTRLKAIRQAYVSEKARSKKVRKAEKNGIYSKSLFDFANRLETNPDKYFARDYDFYYTSGNLCVNPENDKLLHVTGNNMERLTLSIANIEDGLLNVHQIASIDLTDTKKNESEIFEVQFSKMQSNSFFVRQKFCISLNLYEDDKFNALKTFRSKEVPFISFTQDRVNTNHLVMSNLQHQVRFYDLETNLPLKTLELVAAEEVTPASNWNMIKSYASHVYLYAASRRLDMIDTRIPERQWRSNYCGYEEDSYCSQFSSLSLSNFDNLFYVGSNHKFYCLDSRYMGKNIEGKNAAVSRWTHQMSCCPLMMATSRHNDCEYITLQSPLGSDLRICENLQYLAKADIESGVSKKPRTELLSEYVYKSPCLPYMPPSLENVFQEARLQGNCIKPGTGMVNRIKACSTGLSFIGDSSNPYILTATSNGDIFARHLYAADCCDFKSDEASAADVMSRFEENIFRSVRKAPLHVTAVCDLSGISKVFRCPILSDIKPIDDIAIPQKRKYMGRWQKSISTLYKYKDALVSDLLSIWDVEEEEEKDFNLAALVQSTVADSNTLVNGWLNAAETTIHSMTSIPMDVLKESSAVLETSLGESFKINDSQVELEQTTPAAKSKASKKKSRYIKGF